MIILGIDPGLERVSFGIIEKTGSRMTAIEYGLIQTPRIAISDRLRLIHDEIVQLIEKHQPDGIAMERLIFAANKTTAFDVAKAVGVMLYACAENSREVAEYTPPEIKLSVVGNGAADKRQIQFMVTKLLGLVQTPKPDDVADALAIAITHAMRAPISARKLI